jgi:hypothetical protein
MIEIGIGQQDSFNRAMTKGRAAWMKLLKCLNLGV